MAYIVNYELLFRQINRRFRFANFYTFVIVMSELIYGKRMSGKTIKHYSIAESKNIVG